MSATGKRVTLKDEWTAGYICAVAALADSHGCGVEVKELLQAVGPVAREGVDTVDWERLRRWGWTKDGYVVCEQKSNSLAAKERREHKEEFTTKNTKEGGAR